MLVQYPFYGKDGLEDMKKRSFLAVTMLGIALVFTGCKKETKINLDNYSQYKDIDTLSCVTLGEYKDLHITEDLITVSDLEINEKIASVLYENGFYVDTNENPIVAGCQITISMNGLIDGKKNDGFTSDGYQFVYGYDEHVMDGFVANLEGLYQGEKVTFDLVIPSTFSQKEFIGKTATFNVTIENVQSYYTPEFNDEFVQEVSDVTTVEEYRDYLVPIIRQEKLNEIVGNKKAGVWKIVSDSSVINTYPDGSLERKDQQLREQLEIYALMNGLEIEEYVKNFFGVNYDEYVKLSVKQDLLLDAIGRKENISLTQEEYENAAKAHAQKHGYNDVENMIDKIGEDKVKEALLWDKVMEYISEQATIEE